MGDTTPDDMRHLSPTMSTLDHAIDYAARGWHVFPLQPGTKIPLPRTGGHLDATTDLDQIRRWFDNPYQFNIGIACKPSGLMVLDVDVGKGKVGRESLATIDHLLTETLVQRTRNGGLHAVYSRPEGSPTGSKIGFIKDLDLIVGGYIVVAPSVVEGGEYKWIKEDPVVAAPPILIEYATKATPVVEVDPNDATGLEIGEGGRTVALFRLGCALRDQGVSEAALRAALMAENQTRCKPPLDEWEIERSIASIMARVEPTRDVAAGAVFAEKLGIVEPVAPVSRGARLVGDIANDPPVPIREYPSGFKQLDQKLGGGIQTRGVTVIVGPPGTGKTGCILGMARGIADAGNTALVVSTELEARECQGRLSAVVLDKAHKDVLRGRVNLDEVRSAVAPIQVYVMGVEEQVRGIEGLKKMKVEIEKIKESHGEPPVVFVDYLQMLAMVVDPDQVRMGVSALIYGLHMLALSCDCAIVVVSSTSRAGYKKLEDDNPVAYLAAAKESGDIEYAAVAVLYLDVDPDHIAGVHDARIAIAKARSGETGFVGARFHGPSGRWEPNDNALSSMSAGERQSRSDAEEDKVDAALILDGIKTHGARPWKELRLLCGGRVTRLDRAKERMLSSGAIESAETQVIDSVGRMRKKIVICTPDTRPVQPLAPKIVKGSIASKFTR